MKLLGALGLVGLVSCISHLDRGVVKAELERSFEELSASQNSQRLGAESFVGVSEMNPFEYYDNGSEMTWRRGLILREYIDTNMERIMGEQERNLGIEYPGKPVVVIGIPYDFGDRSEGTFISGGYHTVRNRLYLNPDEKYFFGGGKTSLELDSSVVDQVFAHESGHYYMDYVSECFGLVDDDRISRTDNESRAIVISREGVAEFFRFGLDNPGIYIPFNDSQWPSNEFYYGMTFTVYAGGLHLVDPILKKSGVRNGVEWLTKNPPKDSDLLNLPRYRVRALRELETPAWLQITK